VGIVLPHFVLSAQKFANSKMSKQTKHWTITLNNYTEDEIEVWRKLKDHGVSYICFQKEIGETNGTPHLQGYCICEKRIRLSGLKKLVGNRVHAIPSNGSPSSNRAYCSKSKTAVPDTFEEYGEIPANQGKRTDFTAFQDAVKEGLRCKRKAREDFPELVAKYPRWCYDILSDQKDIQVEEHELYEWQSALSEDLLQPPDDRKVIFVIDKRGGQGKTWFAKHYCKKYDDAQYMEPSKKVDMAYALQDDLRVLFLNITRTTDENNLNYLYAFIESVKDGMVFSPKYESRMKYYDKVHVVVMMNQDPNMELLSEDRYYIYNLE
jgi:hypothetical protein